MKTNKKQRCREIFCEYLNENNGRADRPTILNQFMNETQLSKTCSFTYYQTIKKELDL